MLVSLKRSHRLRCYCIKKELHIYGDWWWTDGLQSLEDLIKEIFLWGVGVLYWKRYISATHKLKEHKIAFFKQNKNSFFLRRRHIVVQYLCVLPGWRRRLWEKKMMRQRSLHCLNLPRQRWQLVSTIFLQNGAPVTIMWGNTWNVQDCDSEPTKIGQIKKKIKDIK